MRMSGKRERQRELIIDSARLLFCLRGIENTTMVEIAERSGISRRTLYTYYADKDAVANDIYVANMAALFSQMGQLVYGSNKTDTETLELILRSYLDVRRQHPEYVYYDYIYNNYCASRRYNPRANDAMTGLSQLLYFGRSRQERQQTRKSIGPAADSLYLFFCYLQKSVMLSVQRADLFSKEQDKEDEAYLDFFLQSIRVLAMK